MTTRQFVRANRIPLALCALVFVVNLWLYGMNAAFIAVLASLALGGLIHLAVAKGWKE